MRLLFIILLFSVTACQLRSEKRNKPADIKDVSMDAKINPNEQFNSTIETIPLMNEGVKSLYLQAKKLFDNNELNQAIASLDRAYSLQSKSPQISQLMSEIYLHKGDSKQAHYWASIATKNGPDKGKICEKSWRILALAAGQLGYVANQALALDNQLQCLEKAPSRF